jgi:hypothetical protein
VTGIAIPTAILAHGSPRAVAHVKSPKTPCFLPAIRSLYAGLVAFIPTVAMSLWKWIAVLLQVVNFN